jgi:hypothetical protein
MGLNMAHKIEIPCYYCDGTGYGGDRQIDADTWVRTNDCCCECGGTGVSSRVAGDRYTGYPRTYDPLIKLRDVRKHYLSEKLATPYRGNYRRPSVDDCRETYLRCRQEAMRPAGGVACQ